MFGCIIVAVPLKRRHNALSYYARVDSDLAFWN
jgi:hypothetical protein